MTIARKSPLQHCLKVDQNGTLEENEPKHMFDNAENLK
jgi:hypothetical protein